MKKAKVPEVKEPKIAIKPDEGTQVAGRERRPQVGRRSAVSAGRLYAKARTRKSSLLGGGGNATV